MKKRKILRLGIITIILGISLVSYEYFLAKRNYAFDYMNNKLYLSSSEMPEYIEQEEGEEEIATEESNDEDLTVENNSNSTNSTNNSSNDNNSNDNSNNNNQNNSNNTNNTQNNNKKPNNTKKYYYIGYLEIPKISFKKGFVDINSQDNVVSKNITIISGSKYPNVDKGNFIIAGHSGTGVHSYFKNLYKLSVNDMAYVYYKDVKYTYKIVKIYKQPKNGAIAIYRDYNQTTLTLVTCTKDEKTTQTVYIAELVNKESY